MLSISLFWLWVGTGFPAGHCAVLSPFDTRFSRTPEPPPSSFELLERDAQTVGTRASLIELALTYFQANRIHEAAWTLERAGERETAASLVERLRHFLETENPERTEPRGGTSQNEHLFYANGIEAISKRDAADLIWNHWERDVEPFELDQVMQLSMVPVTVGRELAGANWSIQYWIKDARQGMRNISDTKASDSPGYVAGYEAMWLLDYITENRDRMRVNYLFRPGGFKTGIDNNVIYWPEDRHWESHNGVPPHRHPLNQALVLDENLMNKVRRLNHETLLPIANRLYPERLRQEILRARLKRRDEILEMGKAYVSDERFSPMREGIRVLSATYGANQGGYEGNVTPLVAGTCNGLLQANYRIDHLVLGDPAYGRPKDFRIDWRKQGQTEIQTLYVPPEASGQVIRLE